MSPDPSLKDNMSDSFEDDDDDDMDVYDIFTTPVPRQPRLQQPQLLLQQQHQEALALHQQQQYMRLRQQQQHQQLQQSLYPSGQGEGKPVTPLQVLRPYHPMVLQRTVSMPVYPSVNSIPTQQNTSQSQPQGFAGYPFAQPQQRQQQPSSTALPLDQHANTSLPQYAPNAPPYYVPGAERFVPLPEQFSDLASLDHYVSSLQLQHPALESTIPARDQDMDLMMLSSLTLSSPLDHADATLLQQLTHISTNTTASGSSSVQSPSLSWTSAPLSRETSPSLSPLLQRRQVSYSVPSSAFASPSVTDLSAPLDLASGSSSPSASATASPRRRRRVRPPTVKKAKKIRPSSFACTSPGCDKVFSRAYNLTSHMKTHSTERPFLCGMCPLAFARRHDRERHVRLHTGEKPYSCDVCGAGFMRNDALHRHQKLCGIAGSSFAHIEEPSWPEDPRPCGGSGGQGFLAGSAM
ncbi:hypothetical protein BGZ70_010596 [Mortierella alpina]|uniref:C2H2-type domain-containing protein n=1 Tax=Mortierella alpina TaxID=64518 RepID=A0A9P6LZ39_MORAP|nr:hypothetical protein BGZ70_010596 [Mortierella alpina]